MVSIHGPLGYEPNTLTTAPLRSCDAMLWVVGTDANIFWKTYMEIIWPRAIPLLHTTTRPIPLTRVSHVCVCGWGGVAMGKELGAWSGWRR